MPINPIDIFEDNVKPAIEYFVDNVTSGLETLEEWASAVLDIIKETIGNALEGLGIDPNGIEDFLKGLGEDTLKKLIELMTALKEVQHLAGNLRSEYESILSIVCNRPLKEIMDRENMRIILTIPEKVKRVRSALQIVFKALKVFIDVLPSEDKKAVWEMLDSKDTRFREWLSSV